MEHKDVLAKLRESYPRVKTALRFSNTFELLIATILSAQATDKQVNKVTKELFAKYPDVESFDKLSLEEMAEEIKSIGLYKNKSKHILATCRILLEQYGGQVPQTREELMSLPGVGRKTANVVLSIAFNIPAIAVDTHVFRVAKRLGLAKGNTTLEVEEELMEVIPKEDWSDAHHWLIWHGRLICKARKPECIKCKLNLLCDFNNQEMLGHN